MTIHQSRWPGKPVGWVLNRICYMSVPFTWNMPAVREFVKQTSFIYEKVELGGPGVYLTLHYYPDFLAGLPIEVLPSWPGVLQAVNPLATRTTTGCVRHCSFCAVGTGLVEPGGFCELSDWPDLPVLADNNLLAASELHFDRVVHRLKAHGWADFEQGIDPRLLTAFHAQRIATIKQPLIRLALDGQGLKDEWSRAYQLLRSEGIAKKNIRSYALVGFDTSPDEAWERCQWIESHGVKALPMWYHALDTLERNAVSARQKELGWDDYERRRLMQWFYQHKKAVHGAKTS